MVHEGGYRIRRREERQRLLEEYPQAKHGVIYVLRSGIADYILDENERILKEAGYTFETRLRTKNFSRTYWQKEFPR